MQRYNENQSQNQIVPAGSAPLAQSGPGMFGNSYNQLAEHRPEYQQNTSRGLTWGDAGIAMALLPVSPVSAFAYLAFRTSDNAAANRDEQRTRRERAQQQTTVMTTYIQEQGRVEIARTQEQGRVEAARIAANERQAAAASAERARADRERALAAERAENYRYRESLRALEHRLEMAEARNQQRCCTIS